MKFTLKALCALLIALGAAVSASAHAHGRVFFGFNFGVPLYAPYYPPAYYYPPAVVTAPAAPTVYVERPQAAPIGQAQSQEQWWYYCADSKTYYPYVQSCASDWQRVSPRPPGT